MYKFKYSVSVRFDCIHLVARCVPQASAGAPVNLLDVLKFPATFWLICIICVFYYVTVFPFISMGLLFFRRKYDLDQTTFLIFDLASLSNSMVYILSGAPRLTFSPLFEHVIHLLYLIVTKYFISKRVS